MAPPPAATVSRRPGRRITGNWQDRIAWTLLLGCVLLLLLPEAVRLQIGVPIQTILLAPLRCVAAFVQTTHASSRENQHLAQLAAELAVENARLRSLNRTPAADSMPGVALQRATIISRDPHTLGHWLVLNVGTNRGVRTGSPVLSPDGVVGLVVAAGAHQSLVQTILHPEFRVTVLDTRTKLPALARGRADGLLILDYVAAQSDFATGDTLVTAGLGAVFPRGLRVGTILEVQAHPGVGQRSSPAAASPLFLQVVAQPFANVLQLEELFVLLLPDPATAPGQWLDNLARPEVAIPPSR